MNINKIKPIRQLPELEDHQEWACEGGCDHIEPKLHRNIYAESWDLEGNKTREEAEHYYTCGKGHLLAVWDTLLGEYEDLPEYIFKDRENLFGWDIGNVDSLLEVIQKMEAAYSGEDMKDSPFKFAKASFPFTLKSGEEVSVDKNYLNELKAQLLENGKPHNV